MGRWQSAMAFMELSRILEGTADARCWTDRPVLVTGATGLVGSTLTAALCALEADVVTLVRDWVPRSELVMSGVLDRVRVVRGDIRDQALLERILGDYEVRTVFHLAAQTIVTVANRNPAETFDSNIRGTWALLEAARRSPCVEQIVTASSDKAYGSQPKLPYDESMSLIGKHPYDASKSCADIISQAYAQSYNTPVVITRCGNFFGGGDLNWNRLVPGTIRSIIRGEAPIIRSDGEYVRDYIYLGDAVGAYISLAQELMKRPDLRGEAFNFSNESQITVKELTSLIVEIMDGPFDAKILNQASNEIRMQYLSAKKARDVLGWEPLYTLRESLEETIVWYKNYFSSSA